MMKKLTLEDLKKAQPIIPTPPQPQPEEIDPQTRFNQMAAQRIEGLTHDVVKLIEIVEELRRGRELVL